MFQKNKLITISPTKKGYDIQHNDDLVTDYTRWQHLLTEYQQCYEVSQV